MLSSNGRSSLRIYPRISLIAMTAHCRLLISFAFISCLLAGSSASQDQEEMVRADVLGGLETIKHQIFTFSNDPIAWGDREQQLAIALESLRAIDTAHSRGIGLLASQPLEAQISSIMTAEFRALIDSMGRETTHEMARKLTVGLILGESVGSIRRDLLDSQNEDGSWGIEPGRAGNPLDTAIAITALLGVRPIQVPQDTCLAAAEYLLSAKAENSSNPDNGPFWPLSGETYGESHLEYAAIGLKAIRLIEARVSNNTTRTLRDNARSYVGTGADQSAFDDNNVEENALVLWSIHGLLMWNGSSWPVDAILDIDNTGIKNVTDNPGEPRTVSWDNESGDEDVYTTALAVNALAYWLPELETGQPDLTSLLGDLLLDPATNEIKATYRNVSEFPAVVFPPAASQGSLDPIVFTAGKARIELPTSIPTDELTKSTDYFNEQSTLQSDASQALGVVGPGDEPIPVTLLLDPDGVIAETDESNNRVTLAIDRNDMGFDMSIAESDIAFVENAGSWTVFVTARAIGRDILLSDILQFSLESSTDNINFMTVSTPTTIPSTSGRTASYNWTVSTPSVDTFFRVAISSSEECVSCDTNNSATALANLSAVNSGQNIQIVSLTNQTTSYAPGDDLDLLVNVDWTSIDAAHSSTVLNIRADGGVLNSSTLTLNASGAWSDTITIPGSLLTSIPIRFDSTGALLRRLELTADVDQLGIIPEINEFDNSANVFVSLDYPDLVIDPESISVSHLDLASNPETVVSVGFRNDGTATLDLDATGATIIFEYSTDGITYLPFSSQRISGLLGYGQGQSLSAPLMAPVDTVNIRASVTYDSVPAELSTANNSATTSFVFTRESLRIELRPEVSGSQYSAADAAVVSYDGAIVDLYHQPPPQDPIDPFDGVAVTYEAFIAPIDANSDEFIRLAQQRGQPYSFRIPIEAFQTWTPGDYVIHAYGYEDDRLASRSTTQLEIMPYSGQGLAASVLPPGDGEVATGETAHQIGVVVDGQGVVTFEPALFITISSVSNVPQTLLYEAVLEKHNFTDDEYYEFIGVDNTLPSNIISGELTEIPPGAVNIREEIIIPNTGVFASMLEDAGLYRFWVSLKDTSGTVCADDDAPFRVDQPEEYVLLEKVFVVDGEIVTALRPIEGQEVEVELTIQKSSN